MRGASESAHARATLAGLLALASAGCAAQPCADAGALRAELRDVRIAFVPQPAPVPVGRHFAMDVQVCAAAVAVRAMRIDAEMPAHRHGMNYRAEVQRVAVDRWRAQGLMFHMPGRWRLLIELDTADGLLRLTRELEVE